MADMILKPNEKLDVRNILKDLDKYEPRRKGWVWRKPAPNLKMGPFEFHDVSEPLKNSVGRRLQSSLRTSTRSRFQSSPLKSLPADLKTISEE